MNPTESSATRATAAVQGTLLCHHCGDVCDSADIAIGGLAFCCNGCKTVYELLSAKNLCTYYSVDQAMPGLTPKDHLYTRRYEFLDDESVAAQLLDFSDGDMAVATFNVPAMHCSSCIWLLERMNSLHPGVLKSQVHFPRKEVTITWRRSAITLREVVVLMTSIGYEPLISLQSAVEKRRHSTNRQLYYRIGIAGFAFGNVMLLSFPEYLAPIGTLPAHFRAFFGIVNLALSIPVFFYSCWEFFRPAWIGLKQRHLPIDVPISLGIVMLFGRSVYEILSQTGPGFLDSFCGLIFFMLIGRIFQKKSYDALSFERDFRSYFPLWVTLKDQDREQSIPLTKLKVGDRIVVRNLELIPADAVLLRGEANVDYSFVTGESTLVPKRSGDMIYAGGRQSGQAIELEVLKDISQSYLTRLWNNDVFTKDADVRLPLLINNISKYFTAVVIAIAFIAGAFWLGVGAGAATMVFTAVLIVACPCALALSSPFAFGSAQRIFGNNQLYVKNTETIEALSRIDTVVFDKTGTLTRASLPSVEYHGTPLTPDERMKIKSLARQSAHALSRQLFSTLEGPAGLPVTGYDEAAGKGIAALVDGAMVRIGSRSWTGAPADAVLPPQEHSAVYVAIDGSVRGVFSVANNYRKGLDTLAATLRERYTCVVLSGDDDREEATLRGFFGPETELRFSQTPEDKMRRIMELRAEGRHVLMVGDGLNDAGALKAAQVGVSVSEDINTFSPACDAILSADRFHAFPRFLRYAASSMTIVHTSFAISFAYNIVGLTFAVMGLLSPLVSAILMPVSSVSVVAFTTVATRLMAKREGLH
ncbi:MAG: heavy metal translocating P-type ATPase metal-binding domain-containing protein [Ignavibacteria bacterium]|nr:heavy metal translocating P-type ATPase metal-binding domain-containing protein [Ignavibacteria bacterium]